MTTDPKDTNIPLDERGDDAARHDGEYAGDDHDRPAFNSVVHADDDLSAKMPRGISRRSAVLLFILSSLTGGAIGIAGTKALGNAPDYGKAMFTKIEAQASLINAMSKTLQAQDDQLTALEKTVAANKNAKTQGPSAATTPKGPSIDDAFPALAAPLLARLDKLESASAVEQAGGGDMSALTERLDTYDGYKPVISSLSDSADTTEQRLSALEEEMDTLINWQDSVDTALAAAPPDLPAQPANPASVNRERAALIASFPAQALRAATQLTKKPGLMDRMLSRHVKVLDPAGGLAIIEAAENALKDGDIMGAITNLETLPADMRAPALDWISKARSYTGQQP